MTIDLRAADNPSDLRHRHSAPDVRSMGGGTFSPGRVHALTLVVAAVVLVGANWRQWFFGDEWAFFVYRDIGDRPWRALFGPHNEHWSTIPTLAWRAVFTVVGLRSYLPYAAVLVVAHLLLAHVLWRAMLRCGAAAWVATGLAGVFSVLGAGSENLLWAFQIGFVGSLLFGYLALVLADTAEGSIRCLALTWLAGSAALMCSGVGIVMVAGAALLAGQRRGLRAAAAVAAVPAGLFVVWFVLIGHESTSVPKTRSGVYAIPDFVWSGLTQALERTAGVPSSGALLALGLLGWIVLRASARAIPPLALSSAAGAVLFLAFIAPGRESLGIQTAGAPRYTYICIALLLPAAALLLSELAARTRWPVLVAGLLALVLAWHNLYLLSENSRVDADREAGIRRQILAAADIASSERWLRNRPEPVYEPDVTMEWLAQARVEGWLSPDEGTWTSEDELDVRVRTQVALSPPGALDLPPVTVLAALGVQAEAVTGTATTARAGGRCTRYTPAGPEPRLVLGVDPATGGSARLATASAGDFRVELASAAVVGPRSEPAAFPARPPDGGGVEGGVSIDIASPVERAILTLPTDAPTLVCDVLPGPSSTG